MRNGQVRAVTSVRARGCWSLHSASSSAAISSSWRVGQDEAAAAGVEVEQLGVAAPGDGGLHLAQALLFAELLVEHVEEEVLGDGVVALGFEGAANLAQQQDVAPRRRRGRAPSGAESRSWRTRVPAGGDGRVAFFDVEEAEQLRGIDDGQQVVDLEGEVVGQAVDVVAAALVEQQFEQAGDAAGAGVGQHLVVHLALVADRAAGC